MSKDLVGELTRNAVHVLPEGALEEKLELDRPLRVKLGIDVTSPDVHAWQRHPAPAHARFPGRAGHVGVLIVGDYTTRIGDPSGRSAARPILSDAEIDANARRSSSRLRRARSRRGRRCGSTGSGSRSSTSRRSFA